GLGGRNGHGNAPGGRGGRGCSKVREGARMERHAPQGVAPFRAEPRGGRRVAPPSPMRPLRLPSVVLLLLAGPRVAGFGPAAPRGEGAAPASSFRYVGDETCATCHADLYASYHTTGMGRSVSRFDPAPAPERFDADGRSPVVCHEPSGYCYQAFVRGDTLYQREFRPDTPGYERIHAASHVVGSGNATRSYFMTVGAEGEPGGYVTEMP